MVSALQYGDSYLVLKDVRLRCIIIITIFTIIVTMIITTIHISNTIIIIITTIIIITITNIINMFNLISTSFQPHISIKIHQRGVQWKQGVVIRMLSCTSFIICYYTHPLHPPPTAPPFDEYPLKDMTCQTPLV